MLLNEDCLEAMQKLIDDGVQVDSIVTDPPYHLTSIVDRFGKKGFNLAFRVLGRLQRFCNPVTQNLMNLLITLFLETTCIYWDIGKLKY